MEDDDIFQSFFYRLNTLFEKLTFVTPESVATNGTAHIQNEPKLEIKVAETERARGHCIEGWHFHCSGEMLLTAGLLGTNGKLEM